MSVQPVPTRPRTVTITFWSVIFLGTWNLGRAFAIGQQLDLPQTQLIQPDPRLRLVAGSLFGVLFYGLAWKLGQKRPFVINSIPVAISCYLLYESAVWLLFAQPPRNWTLWLITSLMLIGTVFFNRWSLRRAAQTYFH